jgi:hypothetical protein
MITASSYKKEACTRCKFLFLADKHIIRSAAAFGQPDMNK